MTRDIEPIVTEKPDAVGYVRTANRLSTAFGVWAVVVVIVGSVAILMLRDIQAEQREQDKLIIELQRRTDLIYERQTNVISRLSRVEARQDEEPRR